MASPELTDDFRLLGDAVDFEDADALKARGCALIEAAKAPVSVDLGGLERANTLTVALLLAWYRAARLHDTPIEFVNLSSDLRNIVRFSGLDPVLLDAEEA